MIWAVIGFGRSQPRQYIIPERLADVMALIQVLGLDKDAHRSEEGLQKELKGAPRSGKDWEAVAREHPEFFRVNPSKEKSVSLVARHVTPKDEEGRRELSDEFVGKLLQSAIELHDRQVRRWDRWTYLIPIWVALIAGLATLAAAWLKG